MSVDLLWSVVTICRDCLSMYEQMTHNKIELARVKTEIDFVLPVLTDLMSVQGASLNQHVRQGIKMLHSTIGEALVIMKSVDKAGFFGGAVSIGKDVKTRITEIREVIGRAEQKLSLALVADASNMLHLMAIASETDNGDSGRKEIFKQAEDVEPGNEPAVAGSAVDANYFSSRNEVQPYQQDFCKNVGETWIAKQDTAVFNFAETNSFRDEMTINYSGSLNFVETQQTPQNISAPEMEISSAYFEKLANATDYHNLIDQNQASDPSYQNLLSWHRDSSTQKTSQNVPCPVLSKNNTMETFNVSARCLGPSSYAPRVVSYRTQFMNNHDFEEGAFSGGVSICSRIIFIPWAQTSRLISLDCSSHALSHQPIPEFPSECLGGGILISAPVSRIYFLPTAANRESVWYYYETLTGKFVSYPSALAVAKKSNLFGAFFHTDEASCNGGCYVPTLNRIYLSPFYQDSVKSSWYYIDCNEGKVVSFSFPLLKSIKTALYYRGVFADKQNKLFFLPRRQSVEYQWHGIDCKSGEPFSYAAETAYAPVINAYHGGVYCPGLDRIYLVPDLQASEPFWHYIDCPTCTLVSYPSDPNCIALEEGYRGGIYSPFTDRIYFVPHGQAPLERWHYIDCRTGNVVSYESNAGLLADRAYIGAVLCQSERRIYFVPFGQANQSLWHYLQE